MDLCQGLELFFCYAAFTMAASKAGGYLAVTIA